MQRAIFPFAEQNFWWTVIAQRVYRLFFSRSGKGLGGAKFLVGAYDCKKLFDVCIYLQKSFAFAWKRRLHNYLETVYRRRTKEQPIHGQQDLMHRALGFIGKEYERLWFWKFMIFGTKIDGFWVDFEAKFKPSILKQDKEVWFSGIEMPENAVRQSCNQKFKSYKYCFFDINRKCILNILCYNTNTLASETKGGVTWILAK